MTVKTPSSRDGDGVVDDFVQGFGSIAGLHLRSLVIDVSQDASHVRTAYLHLLDKAVTTAIRVVDEVCAHHLPTFALYARQPQLPLQLPLE